MEVTWDCTESKVGAQLLQRIKRTEAFTSVHAKEILNDIFNLEVSFTQSWVGFFLCRVFLNLLLQMEDYWVERGEAYYLSLPPVSNSGD